MPDIVKYSNPFTNRSYGLIARIGLLTAGTILLFRMIGLLVIYRYMQLDLYACLVALSFLAAGLLMGRRREKTGTAFIEATHDPVLSAGDAAAERTSGETKINALGLLSAREWQVLRLVAEGKTNKEIAAIQFIGLSTVKTHVNNIYSKLSVSNRNEARVKYVELAPQCPVI
jgi:DNA-binding CsgD family transcriptional regulator